MNLRKVLDSSDMEYVVSYGVTYCIGYRVYRKSYCVEVKACDEAEAKELVKREWKERGHKRWLDNYGVKWAEMVITRVDVVGNGSSSDFVDNGD